ncbi:hypothetical protein LSTR_LSTR003029 [Laodelphax striatellus]|uniref:Carboxylic ester hydrolase n=1 Tax=Laodelphax striatellus TaxID=195883 RepID=A0A482XSH2_LAOST|nr:hypothetical protein LSTR_LSTR003029 [Laodelphax striatellus]
MNVQRPQPPTNWTGIYNATFPRDYCLQFSHTPAYAIRGSEDCLYLNLYRPMTNYTNQTKLLDVIVFIHGGAFMFYGSRNFKSVELIKKNFILIAFNYRLGPLGFLSTGDDVVPGNMGLKDQVAVLKWVQENIGHFGGNPNSVTIGGMSAGGASVHYHMMSPLSKGLFSKAISHSGVATNPWSLAEAPRQKTERLAAALNCPTANTTTLIACLKSKSGKDIVSKVPLFQDFLYAPFSPFGPVIEPAHAENAFLTQFPWLAQHNLTSRVPWLVSLTTGEGLYPAAEFIGNEDFLKKLDSNWNAMAPHLFEYNYTVEESKKNEVSEKIKRLYFQGKSIHESPKQLVELLSHRHFETGIVFSTRWFAGPLVRVSCENCQERNNNSDCTGPTYKPQVYVYKFGYSGNCTGSQVFNFTDKSYGVNHGDDLLYIFDNRLFDNSANDKDKEMKERMINIYDSFIRKGNPEFASVIPLAPVEKKGDGVTMLHISAPDNVTQVVEDIGNEYHWYFSMKDHDCITCD